MLGYSRVRDMLDRAQVTRAIQAAGEWGEFGITLEDVIALLHLPIIGNFPEELSAEETAISDVLKATMDEFNKSPKFCYARWLKHWWPREKIPEEPVDEMFLRIVDIFLKPFAIPFAIKMAKGEKLPIGNLFLGSLISNLDSLVIDSSISNFFMKVETYANTMFLQALVWEHFENYALIPRSVLQGPNVDTRHAFLEKDNARIMRWSTKQPQHKIRLTSVLDIESEFNFRPWVSVPLLFSQFITCNVVEDNVTLKSGVSLSDGEKSFILSCTPGYIVSVMHGKFQVEEYNIDRAARQMGLDQCSPGHRMNKTSVEYLKAHLDCTHVKRNDYLFPCSDRATYVTLGYIDFWCQQFEHLHKFAMDVKSLVREFPSAGMIFDRPRFKRLSSGDKIKTPPECSQV
ncbi:uncharacterized protein LOC113360579 [Papaver somniferum]|uniref:uncharacterized protein LOC113360579 n=1 Tax=Papaver somniferum TaxID=3469 RepID=UPI000E6FD878|nr:uncharacterized protein LOC113360579 [Papaver somniferum]